MEETEYLELDEIIKPFPEAETENEPVYYTSLFKTRSGSRSISPVEKTKGKDKPLTDTSKSIKVFCVAIVIVILGMACGFGYLTFQLIKRLTATEDKLALVQFHIENRYAASLSDSIDDIKENVDSLESLSAKVRILNETFRIANKENRNELNKMEMRLVLINDTFHNATAIQRGFSAQGSSFTSIKTNIGRWFSSNKGVFTCDRSGLYFFALSLIKKRSDSRIDMVYCRIWKNGYNQVKTLIDPTDDTTDNGSYGTSTHLVIHLNYGDRVTVGDCSGTGSISGDSTFSGFLIQAD